MNGLLENIALFKHGRSKRISSYDRSGGNADYIFRIGPGEIVDIAKREAESYEKMLNRRKKRK